MKDLRGPKALRDLLEAKIDEAGNMGGYAAEIYALADLDRALSFCDEVPSEDNFALVFEHATYALEILMTFP